MRRDREEPQKAIEGLRKLRRPLPPGFTFDREKRRMPAEVFLDTTILIYAVTEVDARTAVAEELLAAGALSVQVLNELLLSLAESSVWVGRR